MTNTREWWCKITMKNFAEDVIIEVFEEIKNVNPDFCKCEKCRRDVIALALTKIRGRYACSPEGEIFARVEQSDRQVRADALFAVMEALEIVTKYPHHSEDDSLSKK